MSNTIHQEITISASPEQIYEALTNTSQFAECTGMPAKIDFAAGGQFSCFDGMITGQTIEFLPAKRLVQAWRVSNWPAGIYSIVKFELEEINDTETKLIFDHTGYPEEHGEHLAQGWHKQYWEPLKKYLNA